LLLVFLGPHLVAPGYSVPACDVNFFMADAISPYIDNIFVEVLSNQTVPDRRISECE